MTAPTTTSAHAPFEEHVEQGVESRTVPFYVLCRLADRADTEAPVRPLYARALSAFLERHGPLAEIYRWSEAALAYTERPRSKLSRALGGRPLATLHLAYNRAYFESNVVELVQRAERLAARSEALLRSGDRLRLIRDLSGVLSHVLRNASEDAGRLSDGQCRLVNVDLDVAEDDFEVSAQRGAQLTYLGGMLYGLIPVFILAAATGALLNVPLESFSLTTYVSVSMMGAAGAIISVMMRMSRGQFNLVPALGRAWIRTLGGLRPVIGATFGVLLYFTLISDALGFTLSGERRDFYAFCALAFVAGFNERWARDMLVATGNRVGALDTERAPTHDQTD